MNDNQQQGGVGQAQPMNNGGGGMPPQGQPQQGYGPQQHQQQQHMNNGQPMMNGGQPQQPMAGNVQQQGYPGQQNGYAQQPVAPKKPMDPKTKKMIILFSAIGGGVLILGIVALFVLPVIFKIDYSETYAQAKELNAAMSDLDNYDSCYGVVNSADSAYTSRSDYKKYVTNCEKAIVKVKEFTNTVSGTSGMRDGELKVKWDEYKSNFDRLMPIYEQMVTIYPVWHEFRMSEADYKKGSDWEKTATEEGMKKFVKPLADSGVEAFAKYAKGYSDKYIGYVMAYKKRDLAYTAWLDTSYSAANYSTVRDAYYTARDALTTAANAWNAWKSDNSVDLSLEGVFGEDSGDLDYDLGDYYNDFHNELYGKYLLDATRDFLTDL